MSTAVPFSCWAVWLVLFLSFGMASSGFAQEALRSSMEAQAATEARRTQIQSPDYTLKSGDLRLLVTPTLGLDYNDNINLQKDGALDDVILRPNLQLVASHPVTRDNWLFLDIGFGYDKYFNHDEYSQWRLNSGSQLSFDIFIKDFHINLHDRFQYMQDSARESAIAGTCFYGTFNNTIGVGTSWLLNDITLGAGYDHQNTISLEDQFNSQDRASELFYARAGYRFNPQLTAGVEGTVSLTAYDQQFLNDNTGYSAGVYGEWSPGSALSIAPRAGYSLYQFDSTSTFVRTDDVGAWYIDLTLRHDISSPVSYSISAGHELRLGIQSDIIDQWYVRPALQWHVFKNITLNTSFSYERGKQGEGNVIGNLSETYDWFTVGAGANWPILKRLALGLNYRFTFRDSDLSQRDYTQNMVGILLTYLLR